jgi:hypothetical protein
MEMQRIMEMLVKMKPTADAEREERKANQEDLLARMDAKQAEMKADQARMETKLDSNQERMAKLEARMDAKMDSNQASMTKFEGKMEDIMERQMKHLMLATWNTHTEVKKIEQDPGMMQSMEEHRDILTQDAVVMPVGEPRKRRRVRNLAAKSHQKRKERTRGNCGTTCRKKVSRHATVAWRKRNLFRKIWTKVNCGPRSTLAAASRKITRSAKVAWHGAGDTMARDTARTIWEKKPRNDKQTG